MKRNKKGISRVSWISILIIALLLANIILFFIAYNSITYQNNIINNLQDQVNALSSNPSVANMDSTYIKYYRELSDKTDGAINQILVIISIIGGVVSFFSVLLVFKAPHDIDKRIDELKGELESAKEAAEEAKYQAEIAGAMTEDNTQGKIAELTSIIKENPRRYTAYAIRGNLYNSKKRFISAVNDYEMAHRYGLETDMYYNNMAIIFSGKKEYKNAIKYLTKAIEIKPDRSLYFANRANVYSIMDENELAVLDFSEALFLNPDNFDYYMLRSDVYLMLSFMNKEDNEKAEEYKKLAEEDREKAHEIDPENEYFIKNAKGDVIYPSITI